MIVTNDDLGGISLLLLAIGSSRSQIYQQIKNLEILHSIGE